MERTQVHHQSLFLFFFGAKLVYRLGGGDFRRRLFGQGKNEAKERWRKAKRRIKSTRLVHFQCTSREWQCFACKSKRGQQVAVVAANATQNRQANKTRRERSVCNPYYASTTQVDVGKREGLRAKEGGGQRAGERGRGRG